MTTRRWRSVTERPILPPDVRSMREVYGKAVRKVADGGSLEPTPITRGAPRIPEEMRGWSSGQRPTRRAPAVSPEEERPEPPVLPPDSVRMRVLDAIDALMTQESYLLDIDSSEDGIVSKLESLVRTRFPEDWDVDQNFNRVTVHGQISGKTAEYKEYPHVHKLVRPDLIIHRRGQRQNLAVIEVKKGDEVRDRMEKDIQKLEYFILNARYQYEHGLLVVLRTGEDASGVATVLWLSRGSGRVEECRREAGLWRERTIDDLDSYVQAQAYR